jgi:putative membrane protein
MHSMNALLRQAGSQSTWEQSANPILYTIAEIGPKVLAAVALFLVVKALVRWSRYRADSVLGVDAQARVHEALIAAEQRTVGEIVPVVVERSDSHPSACWLAALCTMLLGSALLEAILPWHEPHWLIAWQIGLGAVGFVAAMLLPDLARLFVSESRASEVAAEQAFQEFYRLQLHKTQASTGVLIFVSLFERRVIVLGDEGIDAKVTEAHWAATRDSILSGIKRTSLVDGLVDGIRRCGDELSKHFPWEAGDRNEVPDRLVVRPN